MRGTGFRASRLGEGGAPSVVVLAPRDALETSDTSLRAMAADAARVAERGGLVLVTARWRARRRLERRLTSAGLERIGPPLLVMPGGTIVSVDRRALQRAVAVTPSRWRIVGRAIATALPTAFEVVAEAVVRPYGAPGTQAAGWLRSKDVPAEGGLSIAQSWRGAAGATVVTRVGHGAGLVAKVGTGPESRDVGMREARALELLGASARGAGVDVPELVEVVDLAGRSAAVMTALAGVPAALSPPSARRTAESLARWLTRWSHATRAEGDAVALLRAAILCPLDLLASDVPSVYVGRVRRAVADVKDARAPVAASHGDLTLWNVLVGHHGLGVVDWEGATDRSLPLVDLPYLLVDAVMCRDRSDNRVAAYEACFGHGGSDRAWAGDIVDEVARDLGVSDPWLELATHACWLGHAADERRRGATPTPFLDVLRRHAEASV